MPYISIKLRRRVLRAAGNRCEYCRAAQEMTLATFHFDHIIPQVTGGATVFENLCLSCPFCNQFKGEQWRARDPETRRLVTLFNPRQDRWAEHFEWSRDGTVIIGLTSLWLTVVILALPALAQTNASRPNIIIILADDLGYGDVQSFNPQSKIPTPHLDKLARQGVRFTDAHSPSSVCTPTRYGLLTGRYPWRSRLKAGVLPPLGKPLIEEGRLTLPAMLKQQGYATAIFGKWHLGWDWATTDGIKDVTVEKTFLGGKLVYDRANEQASK